MATKRQKKDEAKRLIDGIPDFPIPRFAPGPIRTPNLILRSAKELAKGLVEVDPLGIITDDEVFQAMVNDPAFKLTSDQVDLINNDSRMLVSTGNGMMEISGRDVIRKSGQFANLPLGVDVTPNKRTRKKTKTDKNMSKALREANARLRTKKGVLRKGKTQGDVMRLAHRLRKKMR